MGNRLKLILSGIAGAIFFGAGLAMFAEPFWAALLSRLKIDSSKWVDPIILLFSTLWFQLFCALMVGAAIGAWLHWAAMAYDKRAPQRDRALCDFLLPRIDSIVENLERISFTPKPLDGSAIAPLTVVPDIKSAYNILEGNGFSIPEIPSNFREVYLAQNTVYFRSIRAVHSELPTGCGKIYRKNL